MELQVQSYLFRNLTLGLRALHGENEHKCLFATPSFSRKLLFWEELTSRNFAPPPPLYSTYLPSLAHPLLKPFFGRPCHWLSRIGWLPFRDCIVIQASHYRRNGKKFGVSSTLCFLATACWGRIWGWGCQFFLLFCSVAEQACYVLMMNFVCPFMTIKRRSLQTAIHLHYDYLVLRACYLL